MAELTIDPQEIRDALEKHVESFHPQVVREEIGHVTESGDGIARVEGLPSTLANELLEFPGGIFGVAMNLDVREIGCVIFGDASGLEEVQAPSVVQHQPVKEPLQTGIKSIDAMTPIGRGQRELIIGDRQTGKTAVAIDAIIAQRDNWASGDPKQQVRCIYVAVGQKASTVAEVVETLSDNGALEYTVVVNASASDPTPFQYIAPYSGAALGAYWMYEGLHALAVYDDLSKQATAYRTLSLLL